MIKLFKHNEEAYRASVKMLSEKGKAAIIHPTGTGKSFIGFKLCEDNPDKTICWLSPSEYIFKTQLENLAAVSDGWQPENIQFITYQKLMKMSDEEISAVHPDYIILDEFHRAGAYEWVKNVWKLILANPDVPMLGLSATHIRYLDNQRNMAEELFDGAVSSFLTLGESIVMNILNPPKYVMSIYSFHTALEKYEQRIRHSKTKSIRDKAEIYLEELRRELDKADGIDDVLDKNMEDRTGKYIVFCANYEHMHEIINNHIRDWVRKIDDDPVIYTFYSADSNADKSFKAFKEDDDDSHLRLLFCIDALNEGVHADDISGVILLRPTVSPIIYKQQIGRALSASKSNNPVIFDIVNNIENLYSIDSVKEEMQAAVQYFRRSGNEKLVVNERFEIIDKVAECRELFDRLEGVLSAGWDTMFSYAKAYYEENGNLEIPELYTVNDENGRPLKLGIWLKHQRAVYSNRSKGVLSEVQIAKLSAIGMRWYKLDADYYWSRFIDECRQYKKEHGNLMIPLDYETEDHIKIGHFIARLRNARKNNKPYRYLTDENIAVLDSLGMVWVVDDFFHEKKFKLLEEYKEKYGDINIMPKGYTDTETGIKLYSWLNAMRYARNHPDAKKKSVITDGDIKRLESLGIVWNTEFQTFYEIAVKFYEKNGHIRMSKSKKIDGRCIGAWLENNRKKYADRKLSKEEISMLEAVGIEWSQELPSKWDICFSAAEKYYIEHGNLNFKAGVKYDGCLLQAWIAEQRRQGEGKSKRKLSDEHRRKLESIGLKFGLRQTDEIWYKRYSEAKEYFSEYGNLNVSVKAGFSGSESLQRWIKTQIKSYHAGKLKYERKKLLDEICIDWNAVSKKKKSVSEKTSKLQAN